MTEVVDYDEQDGQSSQLLRVLPSQCFHKGSELNADGGLNDNFIDVQFVKNEFSTCKCSVRTEEAQQRAIDDETGCEEYMTLDKKAEVLSDMGI